MWDSTPPSASITLELFYIQYSSTSPITSFYVNSCTNRQNNLLFALSLTLPKLCNSYPLKYKTRKGFCAFASQVKRIFVIALTSLYLTFSVGVVIGYHFCGGKLDEITLFKKPKDCCPDANTEKSCCKDTTSLIKISDDHSIDVTSPDAPQPEFIIVIHQIVSNSETASFSSLTNQVFYLHQTKHPDKYPIYLTNRVFII